MNGYINITSSFTWLNTTVFITLVWNINVAAIQA